MTRYGRDYSGRHRRGRDDARRRGRGPAPSPPPESRRYPFEYTIGGRRPPQESPTFGRRGDVAALRWARRHGYDVVGVIPPRKDGRERRGYGAARRRRGEGR